MKVIIVEVTRAANTFGRAHSTEIRAGLRRDRGDRRARRRRTATFRADISPEFATLCFYGAIEQLLTALDLRRDRRRAPEEFEQAKQMLVETVCGGLAVRSQVPGVTA